MSTTVLKTKTITLLATASTPEHLLKAIASYWCSPVYAYAIKGDKILRTKDNSQVENHRIVLKRGGYYRYRFERVDLHKKPTDPKPETFETNEPIPY
jgi:uncharacterized UPF0160 family protein